MGHLPDTRFPDFDYRDPVLFCPPRLQVQVNNIIEFICRECSTGDTMAHRAFPTGCLLTPRLCMEILDLSTNGVAVIDG